MKQNTNKKITPINLVSEKEAEKKYCPEAIAIKNITFCIGSKCMAWRFHISTKESDKPKPLGFCGKAGDKFVWHGRGNW